MKCNNIQPSIDKYASIVYKTFMVHFDNWVSEWVNEWMSEWLSEWVSEWVLFNASSAMFQLYHCEKKLIFNEMMMRSALY